MKFILISAWFPPTSLQGGVVESSYRISTSLTDLGHEVVVICTDAGKKSSKSYASSISKKNKKAPTIIRCHVFISEFYGVTLNLYRIFKAIKSRPDMLIANELFSFISIVSMVFAHLLKVPYILFPRGALMPNVIKKSTSKKYFIKFIGNFLVKKSNCICVTSEAEKQAIQYLFKIKSLTIDIISNGCYKFDFSNFFDKNEFNFLLNGSEKQRIVLFLNRISKEKRLDRLMDAWDNLQSSIDNSVLVIAGDGDKNIIKWLNGRIQQRRLKNKVLYVGPIYGDMKWRLMSRSDVFILPSMSENFGNVVTESLMSKTPVVATKGTPWAELNSYNCGIWVENTTSGIEHGIKVLLSYTPSKRSLMGENGFNLVISKYTWQKAAEKIVFRAKSIKRSSL